MNASPKATSPKKQRKETGQTLASLFDKYKKKKSPKKTKPTDSEREKDLEFLSI